MTQAPCQIVILPIPIAGSPGYDQRRNLPRHYDHGVKPKREGWPAQDIPRPVVDRDLVERMRKLAQEHLADTQHLRAALLAA
jgi:hypothetical protein